MALSPACTCLSCPAHPGAAAAAAGAGPAGFGSSRDRFTSLVGWLGGQEAAAMTHSGLEGRLQADGRGLLRQLIQDHLELRAARENRLPAGRVADAGGVCRGNAEAGHQRALATVFGEVEVRRIAYRKPGHPNLHPADAALNLPGEKHSHGLRRLAAIESPRGSFGGAAAAIERTTGQRIGKRQVEGLAAAAAADFGAFYAGRVPPLADAGDLLVLSCDGKGVVMRPGALRRRAAAKAARAAPKLATRLSRGEVRTRKRMAEVGAVYDAAAAPRSPADILPSTDEQRRSARAGPRAAGKWLTASIAADTATVISAVFDHAQRRDPTCTRTWVALVDGNPDQLHQIHGEAAIRNIPVAIIIDFVHVIEYLWRAAWSFHDGGDPAAETWVRRHALAILSGDTAHVAAAIRRQATTTGLSRTRRAAADTCATYLTSKHPYLDYPTALSRGWPIATGVIEGACRHLVKDRMDITGARWGLDGAEAILKLRAITTNGDFDEYWRYHLAQEQHRVHESRYAGNIIPQAA